MPAKRRLPVDVGAIALAMEDEGTSRTAPETRREHLLDTHTGALITLPRAALDAVLDGRSADLLAPEEREALPQAKAVLRAKPGRYVPIPRRPPPDKYDIMQRFVASVEDPDLRRNLQRALGGNAPFRRFMEVLADDLVEEARWEAYGTTVRRIEAREWLESLDIEPA